MRSRFAKIPKRDNDGKGKNEKRWRIIKIYVERDRLEKLQALEKWISEEEPRTKIIIGEDFNARTGREEGEVTEMGKKRLKESGRQSRDRKINREDKLLVDFIEEREWMILNGNTKKGEEEEYMFTGGSRMVIDCILGDGETKK